MTNEHLLQALMIQIIWKTRLVCWRANQESWSDHNPCAEWLRMEPLTLGRISVTVDDLDGDRYATLEFDGVRFTTELGTKRLYCYGAQGKADSDLTDAELVDWFNRVMDELESLNRAALKA